MNMHANCPASRTLKQGMRATFGASGLPKAGPKTLLAVAALFLLIFGGAKADWQVYDDDVHRQLRDHISPRLGNVSADGSGVGSVTGNQRIAYEQYRLGSSKDSGEAVESPQWPASASVTDANVVSTTTSGFKLEKFSDMTTGAATGSRAMSLTSNIARCAALKPQQKVICEEIVKTENAQFIYAVRFHEMTTKRLERLDELEEERRVLESGPQNYGRLQDNTNQLLALSTRMALDEAQMESAAHAYSSRLSFLRAFQAQKTREQMTGRAAGSGGGLLDIDLRSLGGAVVAGVALKVALESQQSSTPEGYKKMEWLE